MLLQLSGIDGGRPSTLNEERLNITIEVKLDETLQ